MDNKRRLDRITADDYLTDLGDRSVADIRAMRGDVAEEEATLSYERRLLHGRLAILRAELDRRRGGSEGKSLIERLPEILSDEGRGPSRGQFPMQDPKLDFERPKRRVSKLIADDTLANLASLDEDAIERIIGELEEAEVETSAVRRKVQDALDALTQELGRRYQAGEADPTDVLT